MTSFDEIEILCEFAEATGSRGLFVDVGAHVGRYSQRFAQLGWNVVAIEADPKIAALLAEKLDEFDTARTVCGVAWNEAGVEIGFSTNEEHWGTGSIRPFLETHGEAQLFVSTSVAAEIDREDHVSEDHDSPAVFLKIDAEGADFEVLKGSDVGRLLPCLVMIEFMDDRSTVDWGYGAADVVAYMERFGYLALVSEWAAVVEHTRRGGSYQPFAHLGVSRWPLGHGAAWGNLLFVQPDDLELLEECAVRVMSRIGLQRSTELHEYETLRHRADRLEQSILNREKTIAGLSATIDRLRTELDHERSAAAARLASLGGENAELRYGERRASEQLAALTRELAVRTSERNELRQRVEPLERETVGQRRTKESRGRLASWLGGAVDAVAGPFRAAPRS